MPRAVDEVHFKLADIRIEGAVTIPAPEFHDLYASLLGKDITLADILNVADQIEARYRARGYLLVRAFVPPQRVKDGVFTINVVEGYLASVTVQGADNSTRRLIGEYLDPARSARPLTLLAMERGLLMSNDIPGVVATGVLRPAPDAPGASDLVVDTSQPWIEGGVAADNRGSRFSGLWTINADVELNSIFGADQLSGNVTVSPSSIDQVAGQLRYRTAIGSEGLIGSVIGSVTHGQPGSTLTAFNVLTDSWAVGPRLTFPLIRSRAETLILDGGSRFRMHASGCWVQVSVMTSGGCSTSAAATNWRMFSGGHGRPLWTSPRVFPFSERPRTASHRLRDPCQILFFRVSAD